VLGWHTSPYRLNNTVHCSLLLLSGSYLGMTGKRISSPADALFFGLGTHYVPSANLGPLRESLLSANFTDDPHRDVESLLTKFKNEPESGPQLDKFLPYIISSFGPDKSVAESVEELKKCSQSDDAAGTLLLS
jgi:3-hydroxyisobutyryl-CoA hydrolase